MTPKSPASKDSDSILGTTASKETPSPQNRLRGNDSFLSKLGASVNSSAALTTAGAVAALFATNSAASTVDFSQANYRVNENASVATIGVKLNCQPRENPGSVSVSYATSSKDTLTAGSSGAVGGSLAKSPQSNATAGSSGSVGASLTKSNKHTATTGSSASVGASLSKSNKHTATAGSSGSAGASLTKSNKHTATAGSSGSIGASLSKSNKHTATAGSSGSVGASLSKSNKHTATAGSSGSIGASLSKSNKHTATTGSSGSIGASLTKSNKHTATAGSSGSIGASLSKSNKHTATAGSSGSVGGSFATSNKNTTTAGSAGADYRAVSGTLTWGASGSCGTLKHFNVPILEDSIKEGNETVNLSLSNGKKAVLTIIDNDNAAQRKSQRNQPSFAFSQSNYRVKENARFAKIDVKRHCPPGVTQDSASVSYASSNGTATAGSAGSSGSLGGDYTAVSGRLTWGASGNCGASKTFYVPIHNDAKAEANETVHLSLSSPSADSNVGSKSNAVLTIIDNDSR